MGIMKTRSKTLCRKRFTKSYRISFPAQIKTNRFSRVYKEQPDVSVTNKMAPIDSNENELGTILSDIFLGRRKICLSNINKDDDKIYLKLEITNSILEKENFDLSNESLLKQTSNNHQIQSDITDNLPNPIDSANIVRPKSKIHLQKIKNHTSKFTNEEIKSEKKKKVKRKSISIKKKRKSIYCKRMRKDIFRKPVSINNNKVKKYSEMKKFNQKSTVVRPCKYLVPQISEEPIFESVIMSDNKNEKFEPILKFANVKSDNEEKIN